MVWLLIQRLALRLPTALQIRGDRAFLFHEGGTSLFRNLMDNEIYHGLGSTDPSKKIWVLVDSSGVLWEPAPAFRMGRPFFVIEAASRQCCFEWSKKFLLTFFFMKTQSFSEVLQVYMTPPSDVRNAHNFTAARFRGSQEAAHTMNLKSDTYTMSLGRPPGNWPCMPPNQRSSRNSLSHKSGKCAPTICDTFSEPPIPMNAPT